MFKNLFNLEKDNYYGISGLNLELNVLYIYNTFIKSKKSVLVVTNSIYEATNIYQNLSNYTKKVLFFPMDDFLTSEAIAISPEFKFERINTINKIIQGEEYIVVTNLMGFLRFLPDANTWEKNIIELHKNQEISRDYLLEKLYNLGFEKETIVEETGKIGVRGFVLDIFPIGEKYPLRIEFWGDCIEKIKYFDTDTQLSIEEIDNIKIYPVDEFIIDSYDDNVIKKQKYLPNYSKNISNIGKYLKDCICFYYDYNQIKISNNLLLETIKEYKKENEDSLLINYMHEFDNQTFNKEIYIMLTDDFLESKKLNNILRFSSNTIENYEGNLELLKKDIMKYLIQDKTIVLCIDEKNIVKKIIKYFDIKDIILTNQDKIIPHKINIINKTINNGFIYNDYIVIGLNNIFQIQKKKLSSHNKYVIGKKISNINSLVQGDYVVHEIFGIGIYDKLETLTKNGIKKDYLRLKYAGGDVLYIPVEKIDRISKYSAREGAPVKLNKLGTDAWSVKKAKIKEKLEDIAQNLLETSAKRELQKGFAFSKDDESQALFESFFEFSETPDQIKAINNIKEAMEKDTPMDMLLCGDVGYGKTEVAFRAMFKAVNDGKQVAYLCPTTILSNQQYYNAIKRFSKFPINIMVLNRFVEKKKQDEIIKKLQDGKIDILIGTHRLLSDDVKFKDLGLLIVDEEQRFGVKHKEKIKQMKANVDILTLSATPIPRTLQMSLTGIRSLSLITTPPEQRFPIQTYVLPENNNIIKEAIYKEISRNGQVYILFNNIEKLDNVVSLVKKLVPDAQVNYAHGRMTKIQLENVMNDFINRKFNVLVCTSIIETGIDIPTVNTLIIYDADHFGLSQLYQIRGRVGRSNKIGYAYLMYNNHKILTEQAVKRLDALKEFTKLGSGFKVAMRDLSIRGAGDIIGKEQSGFIDNIGIDLYLKLLNDAIKNVKGEFVEPPKEVKNDKPLLDLSTYISGSIVDDEKLKIEIHHKINEIDSLEKLQQTKVELQDRFGKINQDLEIYMYEEWFEKLASYFDITNIIQKNSLINMELPEKITNNIDSEKLFIDCYNINRNIKLDYYNKKIHIILNTNNLDKHYIIYLIKILLQLKEDYQP